MISDISNTVDIDFDSWSHIAEGVEENNGSYILNGCSINSEAELDVNKNTSNQFGFILLISDFIGSKYHDDYVHITFFKENGDLLSASIGYIPIRGNGRIWKEIKVPFQVYKIGISVVGNFTIQAPEVYAVREKNSSVAIATTKTIGIVRPLPKSGLKIVEEGDNKGDLSLDLDPESFEIDESSGQVKLISGAGGSSSVSYGWKKEYDQLPSQAQLAADGIADGDFILVKC